MYMPTLKIGTVYYVIIEDTEDQTNTSINQAQAPIQCPANKRNNITIYCKRYREAREFRKKYVSTLLGLAKLR